MLKETVLSLLIINSHFQWPKVTLDEETYFHLEWWIQIYYLMRFPLLLLCSSEMFLWATFATMFHHFLQHFDHLDMTPLFWAHNVFVLNCKSYLKSDIKLPQEIMILPVGSKTFEEALQIGSETYHHLKVNSFN